MIELTKSEYILELEREYMFLSLAETLPTVGKFHSGLPRFSRKIHRSRLIYQPINQLYN